MFSGLFSVSLHLLMLLRENRGADPRKGKYTYVERSYELDSEDDRDVPANGYGSKAQQSTVVVKSSLAVPVQQLMQLIFNQQYMNETMAALNYDADKMPLGKLSK